MLLGCMRNMVIFPSNAKQIIAIIARIIKLERWYNWGVLQFFDIADPVYWVILLVLFISAIGLYFFYACVRICVLICVGVCVLCEKCFNFSKKSANKIYHEKIRQKFLSSVVPQLSAALLRVRPPSCSSCSCNSKKILEFLLKKVSRFSDSYHGF